MYKCIHIRIIHIKYSELFVNRTIEQTQLTTWLTSKVYFVLMVETVVKRSFIFMTT